MIIENLEIEHLVRIANVFKQQDWRIFHDIGNGWNGFDLIGDNYILQLSYEGSIHVFEKDGYGRVDISILEEDKIRKVLNEILRSK